MESGCTPQNYSRNYCYSLLKIYLLPEPSSLKTQPGCPGGARWRQSFPAKQMEQGTSCPLVSGAQGHAELHIMDQETQGRNLSPVFWLSPCHSGTASLPLPHLAHQALSWGCWWRESLLAQFPYTPSFAAFMITFSSLNQIISPQHSSHALI